MENPIVKSPAVKNKQVQRAIIIVAIIIVLALIVWFEYKKQPLAIAPQKQQPVVACTLEAKLCPDGSYVGRVAPDCHFAPCPPAL